MPLEVLEPWIEPHLAGRPVEQPVGRMRGIDHAEYELDVRITGRAQAGQRRVVGEERAGQSVDQQLGIGVGLEFLRLEELLPGHRLVAGQPAVVAARQDLPQALCEELDHLRGQVGMLQKDRLEVRDEIGKRLREPGRYHQRRLVMAGDFQPVGHNEVLVHVVVTIGYVRHRVRQVLVKTREETEAVLSRQVLAAVLARARNGDRSRLPAAQAGVRLVHLDVVFDRLPVAANQFVCRAHSGHAAADNGHRCTCHRSPSPRPVS